MYGQIFNGKTGNVYKKNEDGDYTDEYETKEITGETSKSFTVEDTDDGVFAVATACGFGMPNGIGGVSEYEAYSIDYYGNNPYQKTLFTKPVVVLAENTVGYREVWGGVDDSYVETVDDGVADWHHDVYELRPGLRDGGIIVQSGTSGSTVEAEKKENTWIVTITQPSFSDGTSYSGIYDTNFKKAKEIYEQHKNS